MCGGKSKSSSETSSSQSTLSADGVVTGKVFNVADNSNVTYTEEFSAPVADAFKQLIGLVEGSAEYAAKFANSNLEATQALASQASQPDLDLVKSFSKYTPIIIGAALITIVLIVRK